MIIAALQVPPLAGTPPATLGDAASAVWVHQIAEALYLSSLSGAQAQFTSVTDTTVLPAGTTGTLFINNGSAAPITITLPVGVITGQNIDAKDIAGNANTYNITFNCSDGSLIDGAAISVFLIDYQAASFRWNGTGWSIL